MIQELIISAYSLLSLFDTISALVNCFLLVLFFRCLRSAKDNTMYLKSKPGLTKSIQKKKIPWKKHKK